MTSESDASSPGPASPTAGDGSIHHEAPFLALAVTALGVVYGDIGTSPLYALKECFHGPHAVAVTSSNILGVLSLIVWSLILIISVKYVFFILRADNRGEGGILALLALILPPAGGARARSSRVVPSFGVLRWILILCGLFGAALLYGDGVITPAISVLSAVEGLEVATPVFRPFVVPITVLVLLGLFLVQRHGTARVGAIFGPVTALWFLAIAGFGVTGILQEPSVLSALSPHHAVRFFLENGVPGFLVLGAVFLCVTGGEALYADMGHFGRKPIRAVWFALVLPSLVVNYLGQGASLMADPTRASNPFYRLLPEWALYPMVGLATAATVIASQALISGAFSLTRQSIQLGYSPRFRVVHTSSEEAGQIYIPAVNWALMAACIGLVFGFRSSSNLAAAYGIAVTMTMAITTILFHFVATEKWRWPKPVALLMTSVFLTVDLSFFGANVVKIEHGGWFPLLVGLLIFTLMSTWKRGRLLVAEVVAKGGMSTDLFLASLDVEKPHRVRGTAVFMTSTTDDVPLVLLHHLKHNKVLHEEVVLMSILTESEPHVAETERLEIERLTGGFWRVVARYGFMESPSVVQILERCRAAGIVAEPMQTTYYLGRETLLASRGEGLATWRKRLFALMARNAQPATRYFNIPPNRVVEVGAQIEF